MASTDAHQHDKVLSHSPRRCTPDGSASKALSVHAHALPESRCHSSSGTSCGGSNWSRPVSIGAQPPDEQLFRTDRPRLLDGSPTIRPFVHAHALPEALAVGRISPSGDQLRLLHPPSCDQLRLLHPPSEDQPLLSTVVGHQAPSGGQRTLSHPPPLDQPLLSFGPGHHPSSGGQPVLPTEVGPSTSLGRDQLPLSLKVGPSREHVGHFSPSKTYPYMDPSLAWPDGPPLTYPLDLVVASPSMTYSGADASADATCPSASKSVTSDTNGGTIGETNLNAIAGCGSGDIVLPYPTDPLSSSPSHSPFASGLPTRDGPIAAGVPNAFRQELLQQQHMLPTPSGSVPYPRSTGTTRWPAWTDQ